MDKDYYLTATPNLPQLPLNLLRNPLNGKYTLAPNISNWLLWLNSCICAGLACSHAASSLWPWLEYISLQPETLESLSCLTSRPANTYSGFVAPMSFSCQPHLVPCPTHSSSGDVKLSCNVILIAGASWTIKLQSKFIITQPCLSRWYTHKWVHWLYLGLPVKTNGPWGEFLWIWLVPRQAAANCLTSMHRPRQYTNIWVQDT